VNENETPPNVASFLPGVKSVGQTLGRAEGDGLLLGDGDGEVDDEGDVPPNRLPPIGRKLMPRTATTSTAAAASAALVEVFRPAVRDRPKTGPWRVLSISERTAS
jgi:hypothetical protein